MSATPRTPLWRPLGNGRCLPDLEIPEQGTSLDGIEKELIQLALQQTGGNQTRAARLLDISRDTLRYRIKKFGLAREPSEGSRDYGGGADEPLPDASADSNC